MHCNFVFGLSDVIIQTSSRASLSQPTELAVVSAVAWDAATIVVDTVALRDTARSDGTRAGFARVASYTPAQDDLFIWLTDSRVAP